MGPRISDNGLYQSSLSGTLIVYLHFINKGTHQKKFTKIIDPMKSTTLSIQVFKYQVFKYSSIQVFKNSRIQVFKSLS